MSPSVNTPSGFDETGFLGNLFLDNILVIQDDWLAFRLGENELMNLKQFQSELQASIDSFYSTGCYFEGLNRKNLEILLYGTSQEIQEIMNDEGIVIFASGKQESDARMDNFAERVYTGGDVQFSPENTGEQYEAKYSIPVSVNVNNSVRQLLGEDFASNPLAHLHIGYLHSFFWKKSVRYFGSSEFLEEIDGKTADLFSQILKYHTGIIAIGEKSVPTQHGTFKEGVTPGVVLRNIYKPDTTVDYSVKKCEVSQLKIGSVICELIGGVLGTSGITVGGEKITPDPVQNVTLADIFNNQDTEYLDTHEEGGRFVVKTKKDTYISKKNGKYVFSSRAQYVGNIGVDNSQERSIANPNLRFGDDVAVDFQGDIFDKGSFLEGGDISYKGKVYGNIRAKKKILIEEGSVFLGIAKVEMGDIEIQKGVITDRTTEIISSNGKVIIRGDIKGATIIGDDVIIEGTAKDCRIVGRNVKIAKNDGSDIKATSMQVGADIGSERSTYTMIVYSGMSKVISGLTENKTQLQSRLMDTNNPPDTLSKIERMIMQIDQRLKVYDGTMRVLSGNISPQAKVDVMLVPFIFDSFLYTAKIISDRDRKDEWYEQLTDRNIPFKSIPFPYSSLRFRSGVSQGDLDSFLSSKIDSKTMAQEDKNQVFSLRISINCMGIKTALLFSYTDTGITIALPKTLDNNVIMDTLHFGMNMPINIIGVVDCTINITRIVPEINAWKIEGKFLDDKVLKNLQKEVLRLQSLKKKGQ